MSEVYKRDKIVVEAELVKSLASLITALELLPVSEDTRNIIRPLMLREGKTKFAFKLHGLLHAIEQGKYS
jgi:hypothetical protein